MNNTAHSLLIMKEIVSSVISKSHCHNTQCYNIGINQFIELSNYIEVGLK